MFIGIWSIVLAVWAWRSESRRWVKLSALAVLLMVIMQGLLGGFLGAGILIGWVLYFLPL